MAIHYLDGEQITLDYYMNLSKAFLEASTPNF